MGEESVKLAVPSAVILIPCTLLLGGCSVDIGGFSFASDSTGSTTTRTATARVSTQEARLTSEGECDADLSLDPSTRPAPPAIAEGITECELVKLKGAKPTDVLVGESGKGQRETQVLYSEPGGREIYMFTDNRLTRIVKPGQG
jgi:hypothetical protein